MVWDFWVAVRTKDFSPASVYCTSGCKFLEVSGLSSCGLGAVSFLQFGAQHVLWELPPSVR
eukprot:916138-Lingulodinium_polyedra.AAC.1